MKRLKLLREVLKVATDDVLTNCFVKIDSK